MNFIQRSVFVVTLLSLSACALLRPYHEPTTGDTASLTLLNQSDRPVTPTLYDPKTDCSNRSFLSDIPSGKETVAKIATGREFTFGIFLVDPRGACRYIVSFTPKKDGHYKALFSADDRMCYLKLLDTTLSGSASKADVPVPYRQRVWREAWTEKDTWCEPVSSR